MLPEQGRIYHAKWSRWWRTFYCRGVWWHEVQFGPIVIQVPRKRSEKKVKVWKTICWR